MITLRTGNPCSDVVMGVYKPDGELTWIRVPSLPLFGDADAARSYERFGLARLSDTYPCRMVLDLRPLLVMSR